MCLSPGSVRHLSIPSANYRSRPQPGPSPADLTILIPQNDLVDRALGPAGTPVQGEAVDNCLQVVADADGEGAQASLVVGFRGGKPGFEVAAASAGGHHLGEC